MTRKTRFVTPGLAVVMAVTGGAARAGDLNPPPGPVAPTMKTLTDVEPRVAINAANTPGDADSRFKITQPGSYYLTGNITGVVGKHGIEIVASGVTLDLNSFDLQGVAGSLDGVSSTVASLTNIAVVNGSVRSWGGDGVDLVSFIVINSRVAEVLASGNIGNGITTGGSCTVSNCTASYNTGGGIATSLCCTISNCSAYINTGYGITTSGSCTVSNCTASYNTGGGIATSTCCTISNCSAYNNTGSGISTSSSCTVADCAVRSNTLDGFVCTSSCVIRGLASAFNGNGGDGAGIHATAGYNRIDGNNCIGADRGIDVDAAGNMIIRNTCSGNSTNWAIVVGNAVAPIVQATTNAAAISGSTYTGSLGSTDPNANFTY